MADKLPKLNPQAQILAKAIAEQAAEAPRASGPRDNFRRRRAGAGRQPDLAAEPPPGLKLGDAHTESPESGSENTESGTDGIGVYDPLTAAREDHDVIVGLLSTITGLLQGLREEIASQVALQEQQQLAVEQLLAAVQQERLLIDELLSNGTDQGPGLGYAASTQATVIDTEAADGYRRWPGSAWEKIMAEVKRVLARLWGMISKLLKVKEWALSGKVGTPGPLLGLAEASVSVTFGR